MKRLRARSSSISQSDSGIDMAPLIDMVFLLLIFYIVTTSFVRLEKVSIDEPTSARGQSINTQPLTIGITADGTWIIRGEIATPQRVDAMLNEALRNSSDKSVLVQADKKLPAGDLIAALDRCYLAGAERVDVATERQ